MPINNTAFHFLVCSNNHFQKVAFNFTFRFWRFRISNGTLFSLSSSASAVTFWSVIMATLPVALFVWSGVASVSCAFSSLLSQWLIWLCTRLWHFGLITMQGEHCSRLTDCPKVVDSRSSTTAPNYAIDSHYSHYSPSSHWLVHLAPRFADQKVHWEENSHTGSVILLYKRYTVCTAHMDIHQRDMIINGRTGKGTQMKDSGAGARRPEAFNYCPSVNVFIWQRKR